MSLSYEGTYLDLARASEKLPKEIKVEQYNTIKETVIAFASNKVVDPLIVEPFLEFIEDCTLHYFDKLIHAINSDDLFDNNPVLKQFRDSQVPQLYRDGGTDMFMGQEVGFLRDEFNKLPFAGNMLALTSEIGLDNPKDDQIVNSTPLVLARQIQTLPDVFKLHPPITGGFTTVDIERFNFQQRSKKTVTGRMHGLVINPTSEALLNFSSLFNMLWPGAAERFAAKHLVSAITRLDQSRHLGILQQDPDFVKSIFTTEEINSFTRW